MLPLEAEYHRVIIIFSLDPYQEYKQNHLFTKLNILTIHIYPN